MSLVNEAKCLLDAYGPAKSERAKKKKKKKKKGKKYEARSFGVFLFDDWKKGKPDPSKLYGGLDKLGYSFGDDYEYHAVGKGGISINKRAMSVDPKVVKLLTRLFNEKE